MHPCLKHARQLLSVILAVADLVSDIILAVNYGVNGHKWWCGLTWAFIVVPIVVGIVLIIRAFLDYKKGKPRDGSTWRLWKGVEICFESGPQMLLQLYIISLAESRGTAMSLGNILIHVDLFFWDVCVIMSQWILLIRMNGSTKMCKISLLWCKIWRSGEEMAP